MPLTVPIGTRMAGDPELTRVLTYPGGGIIPRPVPVAPPLETAPPVDPITVPSPYQQRGEGTTPFIVSSGMERPFVAMPIRPLIDVVSPYEPPPASDQQVFNPNAPVTAQPDRPSPKVGSVIGYWTRLDFSGKVVEGPVQGPASSPPNRMTGWQWAAYISAPLNKPAVPAGVDEVPTPKLPTVAGFDLNMVPWWGWLVAGVIGVRILLK